METGFRAPTRASTRTNDTSDFATIFESYHARLLRYLDTLLRDPSLAEDVAQDTFLRAFQALERGAAPENLNAWLYAIATNAAISALRRRRILGWLPLGRTREPEPIENGPDLGERTAKQELLLRALAHLPKLDAACLLLRFQQGLSYEELAAILKVSVPAAKMRLCRARAAFRTIYLSLDSEDNQ